LLKNILVELVPDLYEKKLA